VAGEAVIGIRLTADGSGFVGAVNVSRESLEKLRGETEKVKPAAESSFGGATSAVKAFLGVIAAGSLAHFIKSINAADAALMNLSQKTGISVEELSRYDKVAAVTGKTMNELADYSVKLGQSLLAAVEKPTSDSARAMQALGFTSEETARLMQRPEEALQRIAGQMGKFQDGTQKNAVAMALFGKQGKDIVPILSDIAQYTRDVGVVTEEQAAKSQHLENSLKIMGVEAQALGRSFLTGLLPAISDVSDAFGDIDNKKESMEGFGEAVGDVFKALAKISATLGTGVKNLSVSIAALVEAAGAAARLDIEGIKSAWALRNEMIDEHNAKLRETLAAIDANAKARENDMDAHVRQMDAWRNAQDRKNKAALDFQKTEDDIRQKQIKAADDFINRLKAEVEVVDLDRIAQLRLQAAKLGVTKQTKSLIDELEAADKKKKKLAETTKRLADEEKNFNDWLKKVEITSDDLNKIRDDALKGAEDYLKKLETEIHLMSLSNEERAVTIALLEAEKFRVGQTAEEYEDFRKKIEAAVRAKFGMEEAVKQQEELRREWKKTQEYIRDTLTDALMRGFEDGKGFAENFRDTLKNMFKTLILRPVIEFAVQGGMNALGGLFGGGSGGGLFSGLGSLIGGLFGGGGGSNIPFGPTQDGGNLANIGMLSRLGSMFGGMFGGGGGGFGAAGISLNFPRNFVHQVVVG